MLRNIIIQRKDTGKIAIYGRYVQYIIVAKVQCKMPEMLSLHLRLGWGTMAFLWFPKRV